MAPPPTPDPAPEAHPRARGAHALVGSASPPPIRCGIAGWSYPDWAGRVYGKGVRDQLAFIARYVDLIEINNTFYRPPEAKNAASWVRRTAALPGFLFSAKLHQDVTHRFTIEPSTVAAFREGLEPIRSAGKLSHLLAQFRYDFADGPGSRDLLHRIRENFGSLAELVIEVRHASWQSLDALEFLRGLGITVANLDFPLARDSFSLEKCLIGRNGYFRLHGRNRKAWFDAKAGRDETYDYLYSPRELARIRERAVSLAISYQSLTIVANNHYRGKEVANALELKHLLTGRKVEVPPALVEEYPRLREIAVEPGPPPGSIV